MDWSFTDKVLFICMFVLMKGWRIIIPGFILGLIALGYFWGAE